MNIKRIMTMRFCLSLGAALAVSSVLAEQRTGPAPDPEGAGVVYVYYPSLCAAAGDLRTARRSGGPAVRHLKAWRRARRMRTPSCGRRVIPA